MITANSMDVLMGNGRFALSLIHPSGDIVYENKLTREMFPDPGEKPAAARFAVPSRWQELMDQMTSGEPVTDEPVLVKGIHSCAEMCYLTIFPQYNPEGTLDSLICLWASRRSALLQASEAGEDYASTDYARDLEAILEHRTYQQMLAAERNETAKDVLDVLPVGVVIADSDGTIQYLNRAMSDVFGLDPHLITAPTLRQCFSEDVGRTVSEVFESGRRSVLDSTDPGGRPVTVDVLPVLQGGEVKQVALQLGRKAQ